MAIKNVLWFGSGLWDPSNRFETSVFLSPWILFALRALFSLYAFATLFFTIGWLCAELDTCARAADTFSYFTVLTYWGLAFYFLAAAVHTLTYALTSRPLLDRLPRPLQALHSLLYSTVVTFPFIVTVVYWVVLFDGTWFDSAFDAWRNVSQHALNSALALFEIVVPRTDPPPWVHLLWLIVILLLYLALAFVRHADQGDYVYSFLDYEVVGGRGYVAAYVLGIAVGICVVFALVWSAILLRRWLTEKKLGWEGRFAKQRSARDPEMMNIVSPQTR